MTLRGKTITLRTKTLFIIGITLILLTVLMYVISSSILMSGFSQVEKQDTKNNVQRATDALNADLSTLGGVASDWAAWDETYNFIEDGDPLYLKENINNKTFIEMNINFMFFINLSGGVVWESNFDLINETLIPVPDNMHNRISGTAALLQHSSREGNIMGLVQLPEGPAIVVSSPILDNERIKPVRGSMIWGRYLNDEQIKRFGEITHLSLHIQKYNAMQMSPDFRAARNSITDDDPIFVQPLDEQSIAGYTIIKDIQGDPALLLQVDIPRAIYNQSKISVKYLIFSLIIVGIIFTGISIMLLEKLILSRIYNLSIDIGSIGASGKLSKRVKLQGNDEISNLASSINGMLELLERAELDLKKADEIRLENERLLYSNKAKSEFLANMSHELRTPLNGIIGFSEILKRKTGGELSEQQIHFIDYILISSNHLLNLISDILDLTKIEAGKLEVNLEKIPLAQVIEESTIPIKEKAKNNNVIIKTQLDPELEFIEADRLRFKQILFNLISNAVKFSKPEGGIITITSKREGDIARFSVSDTGIGIQNENMTKIFNSFEQLDSGITRKYGGSGLGLSISKKLVELHGGTIKVESTYGEGSIFSFTLSLK
jgi:signal transduction histidine kinase